MTQFHAIQLIPYQDDPLAALAAQLLQRHHEQLPRLDDVVVLLPEMEAAVRLRRLLLEQAAVHGYSALLGPRITTLRGWLNTLPSSEMPPVACDYQRILIMVEALREHRTLFGDGNLWALADSLLGLFDELTLNQVALPENLQQFITAVAHGYGLQGSHPAALDREARLIHTLWHAWHQQLHARHLIDQNSRLLLQLANSLHAPSPFPLYMAGLPTLSRAEQEWLGVLLRQGRITLLLQGEGGDAPSRVYHPQTPLSNFLDALQLPLPPKEKGSIRNTFLDCIYQPAPGSSPLRERAENFARQTPTSPLSGSVQIFHAEGDEQEARAVELQVRRWLLAGKSQLGIVTENRRLARRVRALLERAGIHLHDAAGWALSTTSAAATLERWLQCIEEDFGHQAMLDLLKSAFMHHGATAENPLRLVYRLEQDIVLHEGIGSGLERYLRQTRFRQHRLPHELAEGLEGVIALLERLQKAAEPLLRLFGTEHPASRYLEALLDSLQRLGLAEGLAGDAAGLQLLDELQRMQQAAAGEIQPLSWLEFRGWLGRTLEHAHFHPAPQGHAVSLIGLGQSQLQHFDALIMAGLESESMPGSTPASPFFNDAVRHELQLPTAESRLAERFFHFRRLLESSDILLLTLRRQQDGEDVLPSPWLESLRSFHAIAYGDALEDMELHELLHDHNSLVVDRRFPLPEGSAPPRPTLPPALLPQSYSASAYQQLMDCPYQFYASRGLRLSPPEAIREALQKSDYGERVHRILQAFHGGITGLPGPFRQRLTAQNRAAAEQLLYQISHAVFAEDLEDNFLHRGWLLRWQQRIPEYLDWQLAREAEWRVTDVEVDLRTQELAPGIKLQGRLDRIDQSDNAMAVVDYKTGSIASEDQVRTGEAVQLPFYAILARQQQLPVGQVEYLALDSPKLGTRVTLQDEELDELSGRIAERLVALHGEMMTAQSLPAWGDAAVCNYCPMGGICRRELWTAE